MSGLLLWAADRLGLTKAALTVILLGIAFLAIAGSVTAFILHERAIGRAEQIVQDKKEDDDAIAKAERARAALKALCAANPAADQCMRDGWSLP